MNDKSNVYTELQYLYQALTIAREGLNAIKDHDQIAVKTLIEIDKIVEKIKQL
mgnify:CR=1 FL=1